ncbi:DUF4231 domain-containing protein [Chitinophagaceae bacterium MMS25-I14]
MNINYIEDRVNPCLDWYDRKSKINKHTYFTFTISEIVLAALIPFISGMHEADADKIKYILSLIGVILTILGGIALLGKYQEKWINYRRISENIKKEKYMYLMKVAPYDGSDAEEIFVKNTEYEMEREVRSWYMQRQKQQKG